MSNQNQIKPGSPEWDKIMQEKRSEQQKNAKEYYAKRFGIPIEEIVWSNSGICYSRIIVKSLGTAILIREKVKNSEVNGGMFHGMSLGGHQLNAEGHYDVMI
jgi:hypothetical protein